MLVRVFSIAREWQWSRGFRLRLRNLRPRPRLDLSLDHWRMRCLRKVSWRVRPSIWLLGLPISLQSRAIVGQP